MICSEMRVVQVKVLNRGAFGVVVLAKDKQEGEHYALKFIERGPQVGPSTCSMPNLAGALHPEGTALPAL